LPATKWDEHNRLVHFFLVAFSATRRLILLHAGISLVNRKFKIRHYRPLVFLISHNSRCHPSGLQNILKLVQPLPAERQKNETKNASLFVAPLRPLFPENALSIVFIDYF
jgi:hypothetical protein